LKDDFPTNRRIDSTLRKKNAEEEQNKMEKRRKRLKKIKKWRGNKFGKKDGG